MKRFCQIVSCVAVLAFAMAANAVDLAGVKVQSPHEFKRDRKVVLEVSGLQGTTARVKWWIRSDDGRAHPDHEVFADGRVCAVWAIPGKYEALITVGIPDPKSTVLWVDIEHKFTIGEVGPTPPLPPGPQPPDPVTPSNPSSYNNAAETVKKLSESVRDDDKESAAKVFAAAYREHGKLALKGEYKNADVLADATSTDFVYELGMSRYLRWRPMMTKMRDHMTGLINDGKMKDMNDWGRLWEEYAKGFESIKNSEGANVPSKK